MGKITNEVFVLPLIRHVWFGGSNNLTKKKEKIKAMKQPKRWESQLLLAPFCLLFTDHYSRCQMINAAVTAAPSFFFKVQIQGAKVNTIILPGLPV